MIWHRSGSMGRTPVTQRPDRPRATFREVSGHEAAAAADAIYEAVRRRAEQALSRLPDDYAGIVDFVLEHARIMTVDELDAALLLSEFLRGRAHRGLEAAELRQYRLMRLAHDGAHDYADIGRILGLTKRGAISRMTRMAAVDRGDGTVRTFAALAEARRRDAELAAAAAAGAEQLRAAATWIATHQDRYLGDSDFADDCAELEELVARWPDDDDAIVVRAQKLRVLLRPLVQGLGPGAEGAIAPVDERDVDAVGVLALTRGLV
jgi:hypothetical protein